jgi:hypothetical protein
MYGLKPAKKENDDDEDGRRKLGEVGVLWFYSPVSRVPSLRM